ncbi:hypothetical protein GF1_04010 [Desulfolithobacter dissulfuricans]|uniref:Uncharacterized protein n=1 Tax=Desulfolithobacter dissulfuricans TaxID=2795293 RepID=A0A915TZC6_9BACT|nr:hypothetical protein [Desulfolithobacter dissulfuricans]BCO08025.1 hypothetical protein GF1_04010 [Desulfolithobacter dissulfuricans]
MSKKYTAFTPLQMFYHKAIIILMFFFILTGLPILFSSFHWIAYCFGFPFDFITAVPDLPPAQPANRTI